MILTGRRIVEAVRKGTIVLRPFDRAQINPNSYNYRLGSKLKVFERLERARPVFTERVIPEEGFVLRPGTMYLGHTLETIGSKAYAMSLIGRSSMGRYGLFLQVSANLGHTGSCHRWTLELHAAQPIRVYPGMRIGQVSFWTNRGSIPIHSGKYADCSSIRRCRFGYGPGCCWRRSPSGSRSATSSSIEASTSVRSVPGRRSRIWIGRSGDDRNAP